MRSIELFAGAGGLGIGLHQAGFHPVTVVERDRHCGDTIRENAKRGVAAVEGWNLHDGDVREVDFAQYRGRIQLLSGGPPCQPFSAGGQHRAHGDSRDMFPQAIRAIRETHPPAFILENVRGLTRTAFQNYFEYIRLQLTYPELEAAADEAWADHLSRLESHHVSGSRSGLVYRLVTQVVNAADYGIAQKRHRVFFVGLRHDLNVNWRFPQPTHSRDALQNFMASGLYWERHRVAKQRRALAAAAGPAATLPWRTVRDALVDLPDPESEPSRASAFPNHKFQPGARAYPGHTGSPLDEPAKALKAGVHGVPGGENMLRKPDGAVRYFTVREAARLQTFPDDFVFHGAWSETMRQLGNAVPVELARIVGESVAKHLG
jgi:DNA (cytosine-5)-methyltransferase 1